MALLNIVVGVEIRSTFERSLATKQLVEDDTKRPVVATVAELAHVTERLWCEVLLSTDKAVHTRGKRVHVELAIIVVAKAVE